MTRRQRRRAVISRVASNQGGLIGRRQLYALGLSRSEVRAEVRAGRWSCAGSQCLQVASPDHRSAWWRALFEVGPGAVLAGVTALQAAGLRTISEDTIHVAVPKSATPRHARGVRVHETRRYRSEDVIREGIPRTTPATATVHAALWARSNSQAALFVIAAVQQRLVSISDLATAIDAVRRDRRRALLRGLLHDVRAGIESLGEREFARLCRRRGLPEPNRQTLRRTASGRVYYDVEWEAFGVVVEIDGVQHLDAAAAVLDALKQNVVAMEGRVVLRVPCFALRADPEPFLDQLEAALIRGGWVRPEAA